MNSGQYPVQMTRKPMQERGLKGVKNPKTALGEPATGPSRSLHLRRSFRKSVSIYPRSAPVVDSAIAIGVLVGVSVLSVCVFGAIAYAVASRKTKDKDSKYVHLYPVSSHGFSPGIYT